MLAPIAGLLASGCDGPPPVEDEMGSAPPPRGERVEAERAEVTHLAYEFMQALSERDTARLGELLAPHARLFSIREGQSGPIYGVRTREAFLRELAEGGPGFLERIWDPVVEVAGRVAMVWAPYDFHVGAERSHCGVDILAFMKLEVGWKVTSITYNVVREGCPESPLGRPRG
jgi:hypothetical protein